MEEALKAVLDKIPGSPAEDIEYLSRAVLNLVMAKEVLNRNTQFSANPLENISEFFNAT